MHKGQFSCKYDLQNKDNIYIFSQSFAPFAAEWNMGRLYTAHSLIDESNCKVNELVQKHPTNPKI